MAIPNDDQIAYLLAHAGGNVIPQIITTCVVCSVLSVFFVGFTLTLAMGYKYAYDVERLAERDSIGKPSRLTLRF